MQYHDEVFTKTIDNTSGSGQMVFVTDLNWGLEKFSVMCKSDVDIMIEGTRTLGANSSEPIALSKGESFTWTKANGLKPFTVIVPVNAIAIITAI